VDDPRLNKREDSGMPDGNVGILAPHGAGNNVTQFFSALPLYFSHIPVASRTHRRDAENAEGAQRKDLRLCSFRTRWLVLVR